MYLCGWVAVVVVAIADVAAAAVVDVVAVSDWWETILSCIEKKTTVSLAFLIE